MVPRGGAALVITVRLPPALEALRLRGIVEAQHGVPAHITLLYPFAEPSTIGPAVLKTVRRIARTHECMTVRLVEPCLWPDTLYASVEPVAELRSLYEDLAAAFPAFPLYGGAFSFTPHVSIAEGPAAGGPDLPGHPAWRALPMEVAVSAVDLVVLDDTGWHRAHRFPLARRRSRRVAPAQGVDDD